MYIIDKSFVYQIEKTEHYEIKAGIGPVKRLELIFEDETVKNYEWQKFSLEKSRYIIDEEYSETVEINGKEYKADRGKITVPKEFSESETKLKNLEEKLNATGKQLAKEKLESIKKDKVISELGKHETKLALDIIRNKNEITVIKQQLKEKGGN